MRKWKAVIAGLLVFCLLCVTPFSVIYAEEEEEEETEQPIPDSYYYPIESNDWAGWPQGPAIESAAAVVMDMDTGTFLYSKNAEATMYPASTTKILTTLLLLENCSLEDEITYSGIVYDLEEGSSHLGIMPGEEMKLEDAAYGIMLASANDISNGVAEYIGGSLEGFADLMNQKASELGCVNTHFANPHGLYQDDHYTCARDMALIAKAAYDNETFRKIAGTKEYTIPETNLVEEQRSFLNHHKMMQKDSDYYREWCTGGKTGFTSQCLNTLVTFAEKDGMRLVSVVFRVNGAGKAYEESTAILEYAFDNFFSEKFEKADEKTAFYDIMGLRYFGKASLFQLPIWEKDAYRGGSLSMILPVSAAEKDIKYQTDTAGDVTKISYYYHDNLVGSAQGAFANSFAPVQTVFERQPEVVETAASAGNSIQIESLEEVLDQGAALLEGGYRLFRDYAQENTMAVLAGGSVLLVLLVLFIVVMIFRATADSRIRRRRRLAEKERLKREEEIDRMTTAEIEAELRAVMAQEEQHRAMEQKALAEAERAAREAAEADRKARETEILLEELEKERQEKLSSQEKGINS